MGFTLKLGLFSVLLLVSFQLGKGDGSDNDVPDYGYYHEYIANQSPPGNETLTLDQVRQMIDDSVRESRRHILNDPELKSLIELQIKNHQKARQKCLENETNYFDYAIGDCKSCLHDGCEKDATCKTECRAYFETAALKQEALQSNQELQRIKSAVESLQTSQNDRSHQTWLIVLTVMTAAVMFTATLLIYFVITRTSPRGEKERLATAFHPLSDFMAEARRLLGRSRGAADADNGPNGNQA